MKSKEEIINIIENVLQIKSDEDFSSVFLQKLETGIDDSDVELLSPDNIDNCAFWEYIENKYSKAICATHHTDHKVSIQEQNYLNWILLTHFGILDYYKVLKARLNYDNITLNLLEIGAGYGSLYNTVDTTDTNYFGIDVNPRFDKIIKCTGYGIPEQLKDKKYHYIVSSNVFQHLSDTQRLKYYQDSSELLETNGYFVFSIQTYSPYVRLFQHQQNKKWYICHYGQFTSVPDNVNIVIKDVLSNSNNLEYTQVNIRWDGYSTFIFRKQ